MELPPSEPEPAAAPADLSHAVRVLPAAALLVDSGANAGDALGPPDEAVCGDYYRLADTETAGLRLRLAVEDGAAGIVAAGSDLGREGDRVMLEGRLSLMAPDGDAIDLLVLTLPGPPGAPAARQRLALPLAPMRPGLLYTLIATDTRPGPIRLADAVAGAFAGGTRVALANGTLCPVEDMTPGMAVLTRDHGAQPLRWIGAVRLRAEGSLAPVVFGPGVMGNPRPLAVSPHHRMFLYRRDARALAGAAELLVQARHLVDGQGIRRRIGGHVVYHGLVFDRHEVIYAEGVPCESLMVCPDTLTRLPEELAAPLRAAFPGLEQRLHQGVDLEAGPGAYPDMEPGMDSGMDPGPDLVSRLVGRDGRGGRIAG